MPLLAPPRRLLSWTATSLTTSFGGYRVYRRPSRTPVAPWSRIGDLTVPTGYTAATVEAQHTQFLDLEAGWSYAGAQWEEGWDYAVTVVNAGTGLESPIGVPTITRVTVSPDVNPWLVSNAAPFLSFPAPCFVQLGGGDSTNVVVETAPQGRDRALTRTRLELPYRTFAFGWRDYDRAGQDGARVYRAAQAVGATMALHLLHGDRVIGTLRSLDKFDYGKVGDITYGGKLVETSGEGAYVAADYNLPAGAVLDGSADYFTTPDNALLDPGTGAFTVLWCGTLVEDGADAAAIAKGEHFSATSSWYLGRTSANRLTFSIGDTGGTFREVNVDSATSFGDDRVLAGMHDGAGAMSVWRDGVVVGGPTAGSVPTASNSLAMTVGADNAGAGRRAAQTPVYAWAYYARALTDDEHLAAAYYLRGYPGYRMPAGAVCFVDLRDARSWNGASTVVADLSDNKLNATAVSTPPTRGIPSGLLALIDRAG